jgi:hypothetical protein
LLIGKCMIQGYTPRVPFSLHRVVNELTTFGIQSLNKGCWPEWLEAIEGPEDPTQVVENGYVFAWWDNADKRTFIPWAQDLPNHLPRYGQHVRSLVVQVFVPGSPLLNSWDVRLPIYLLSLGEVTIPKQCSCLNCMIASVDWKLLNHKNSPRYGEKSP